MALTNFGLLTDEEKTIWSMDFWSKARNYAFMSKFMGTSQDSLIQRVTELRKTEKGARAVITLVNDLAGDGRAGDRQLEGNEEALNSEEFVIQIDQLRHANRHQGRMAEQRSVVTFREESRDKLAYWIADRMDQLAFLTLSGVDYSMQTNGVPRVGSDLPLLDYAADVTAPTNERSFNIDNTDADNPVLAAGNTATLTAGDTLSWKILVSLKAEAKTRYVRPLRISNGIEFYHVFVHPLAMAALKKDPDYLNNVRHAGVRGSANDLFKGTDTVFVDGLAISEYRHVYNTRGAASGAKWGVGSDVDGCATLFCGAQALAFADIGNAYWVEEEFDYKNQPGISVGKIMGYRKPIFKSKDSANQLGTVQDFGVIRLNTAL